MFADVIADFDDRVREVDLYFQFLSALDNNELAIVDGIGPQVVPLGAPPNDWGRMLKGAGFLVLYNLVEAFVNRGFQAVFDAIAADGICGADLTESLRSEWIEQKNRKVKAFDGSPKVYMKIAEEIVGEIVDRSVVRLSREFLPWQGNLDADSIRVVCSRHGVNHHTPPAAKGGVELSLVKTRRNALAHGTESFAEGGRDRVAPDLVRIKGEVVLFVRGILQNLETFARNKGYKA